MGREDQLRRSGVADRRRAQVYLAQLAWLDAFDGSGFEQDTGRPLELDGAVIARSRRAARTALREHPAALPKLVGDVDAWWALVDARLAWCSALATGRAAAFDPRPFLPPRVVRALAAAPASVRDVAERLAIAWVARPALLERALAWLAAHAAALADTQLESDEQARIAILLARWVASGDTSRGAGELLAMLAVDAPEPEPALAAIEHLEAQLRATSHERPRSPERSRPRVVAWIGEIARREARSRRRLLELIAEAGIAGALHAWQAWEREHAALVARAAELGATSVPWETRKLHSDRVLAKLASAREAAPPPVSITGVILEVNMLAADPFARVHPSIVRFLAALPATKAITRARMLLHCARSAACAGSDRVEWIWDAFARAFERGAPASLLDLWHTVLTSADRMWFEEDLASYATRATDADRGVRAIVELAVRGRTVWRDEAVRAAVWSAAGLRDTALVADVVDALRLTGRLEVDVARAVIALVGDGPADRAAELARTGRQIAELTHELPRPLEKKLVALVEHAVACGAAWLVRGELAAGRGAALVDVLGVAPPTRARMPPLAREVAAPWTARYPEALAPALRRLASVDPDAEATAARRLATDLPDPASVRRELVALRDRVGDRPGLAKRIATLEARLAAPRAPSAVRLARLAGKLERAACELGLARFRDALVAAASDRIRRAFGLAALPAWAEAPAVRASLFALLELDEADRRLAGRLLRARCGAPPWDLRGEPANRAFLERMRGAGVDPRPWLDDGVHVISDGLTLALTADPLEVFQMGAHFQTCLAPDGGNFFSVVANAADINKRVLYARRGNAVVGRCLFALTDGFALLAFHPYCHDRALAFDDVVRDFAIDLARRMRTTLVPRGTVRTLLANAWYDDGPRDLVGRFRGLDEAGLDLTTIAPEALVEALRGALARELDDVTLPLVLEHDGLQRRPQLVFPLASCLVASRVPRTRIAAARLALDAGDRALADRLLGEHASQIRLDGHRSGTEAEMLAELRPSYLLARLRATRDRDVRSWNQESADRIVLAGIALEALHRKKQAAAMYRLAMAYEYLVAPMRERLRSLGEPA